MSRALVFLLAVVVHVALIVLLAHDRGIRNETAVIDEPRMVLVFLPPDPVVEPDEPAAPLPPARGPRRARSTPGNEPAPAHPSQPPDSNAITEPPPAPSVDWMRESELAASRQIDALENSRRRARGFVPREDRKGADAPAPAPEFGWDRSHTERIEPIPSGGMLIHLNDRCAVAFAVIIIPVCKIGKIGARGDLFEHMNDTPQLGDEAR